MPDTPDVSDGRKVGRLACVLYLRWRRRRKDAIRNPNNTHQQVNALLAKYSTLILIVLYILLGVVFYTNEEDWSVLNSMFFIMFTLTTVGYGCPDCPTYVRKGWSG